ncbi:hypothetical protein EVAR_96843_1 [Eumeta japonica]|uniref:Uncharacterized protein n=1 Tax=Eumeta variegata TaxID=151549 RepID=A0A4C1WDK3_EUMVA|nr:hypothetical protein EVAR_96843_1 [Eumeta japonica]
MEEETIGERGRYTGALQFSDISARCSGVFATLAVNALGRIRGRTTETALHNSATNSIHVFRPPRNGNFTGFYDRRVGGNNECGHRCGDHFAKPTAQRALPDARDAWFELSRQVKNSLVDPPMVRYRRTVACEIMYDNLIALAQRYPLILIHAVPTSWAKTRALSAPGYRFDDERPASRKVFSIANPHSGRRTAPAGGLAGVRDPIVVEMTPVPSARTPWASAVTLAARKHARFRE